VFGLTAAIVGSTPSGAQISNEVVKIGVLSDMSSLYSDSTGPGSLIAAQMAAGRRRAAVRKNFQICPTPPLPPNRPAEAAGVTCCCG